MTTLCALSELAPGDAAGFEAELDGRPVALIVVRVGETVAAWRNVCPHKGTPLDWPEGHFLDAEGVYLQCATHGALFEPATGLCVAGPCRGRSLQAVPVVVEKGQVRVIS